MRKITALLFVALFSIGAFAAAAKPKIGMKRAQEIAGAKAVSAQFKSRAWAKDDITLIALHWDSPVQTSRPPRRKS